MHKIKFILLIMALFVSLAHAAQVIDPYPFTSTDDAARFAAITKEVRCVVCQNQNIADSNAPLASDLRQKIYVMVLEKQSNEDIKNYLVKRYGEFILLQPRFSKLTFLLWTFPALAIISAFLLLIRTIKQRDPKRV